MSPSQLIRCLVIAAALSLSAFVQAAEQFPQPGSRLPHDQVIRCATLGEQGQDRRVCLVELFEDGVGGRGNHGRALCAKRGFLVSQVNLLLCNAKSSTGGRSEANAIADFDQAGGAARIFATSPAILWRGDEQGC